MAAEGLTLVDVGNVDLDDRAGERGEGVENGDRGVAEAGRVDDDRRRALARLVNPVDELVFAIALAEVDRRPNSAATRRQSASTSASVSRP